MTDSQFSTQRLSTDAADILRAADMLTQGQLVAFPTETVYGLGADARSGIGVAEIFAAKGRPQFNPLIVHVADAAMAARYVAMTGVAQKLAEAFWPGPLTLVLPRVASDISDLVTAGLPSLAIRVPAHPVARALLAAFGGPVAAPSANLSGQISPTTADHVMHGLAGRIAAVVDGGACAVGLESTIVGLEGGAALLRPGGISVEAIEEVLGMRLVRPEQGGPVTAPGQLLSHYAPDAIVRLDAVMAKPGEVLLGFGEIIGDETLSPTGDLIEAAARLFGALRRIDQTAERIAVAPIPHHGLGLAINDRLQRAAAPKD